MTRVNVNAGYMIITGFYSSVISNGDFKIQFEYKHRQVLCPKQINTTLPKSYQ